jgi:hypothetical protein
MCILCDTPPDDIDDESLMISCENIDTLPNLPHVHTLFIEECDNLLNIPHLRNLRKLDIVDCEMFHRLPSCNRLVELFISNTSIQFLPSMRSLEILDIRHCQRLKTIAGTMPNLTTMIVIQCEQFVLPPPEKVPSLFELEMKHSYIETIPNYPLLNFLSIDSMYLLSEIPQFDNLESLIMMNCMLIAKIPAIPILYRLSIYGTHGFLEMPGSPSDLPNLTILHISNYWVRHIPAYPRLQKVRCRNCPYLQDVSGMNLILLEINNCPMVTAMPTTIDELEYFECDERSPLRVYMNFFISNPGRTTEEKGRYDQNMNKLHYLQYKFRDYLSKRRIRKFLSLCFSESFCVKFWNPDEMGGQWCIRRLYRFCNQLP